MRCVAFCTAVKYKLNNVMNFAKSQGFIVKISRNVLQVQAPDYKKNIFVFANGCFVCWGLTSRQEQQWLKDMRVFAVNPLKKIEMDYFSYHIDKETDIYTHERLNIDVIELEEDDSDLKLAVSYALAQSVKLESYEELIEKTIRENKYLPIELAEKGKISLPRKAILKRLGGIFIERSSINLRSEYLDTPEYFWRHPNIEEYYVMAKQFLDISSRVQSLNQKLDVLHELFDILTNQLQYRHTVLLETIIVLLILIEVIMSLVNIFFSFKHGILF